MDARGCRPLANSTLLGKSLGAGADNPACDTVAPAIIVPSAAVPDTAAPSVPVVTAAAAAAVAAFWSLLQLYGDPVADFKKGAILECFAHEEGAWYPVELVGKQRGRYPSTGTPIAAAAGATAVTTSQTPGSDSGAERAEGPSSCGGIGVGEESEDAGDGAGPSGNGVCGGSGAAAGGRKAWVKFESDTDEGETVGAGISLSCV